MSFAKTLSRDEMKNIMAGYKDPMTCEEFHSETGCYPTFSSPSTCEGRDGNTYTYSTSSGSCG